MLNYTNLTVFLLIGRAGRRRCSSDKKSAERSASRRERKATKTLAIVLGLYVVQCSVARGAIEVSQ